MFLETYHKGWPTPVSIFRWGNPPKAVTHVVKSRRNKKVSESTQSNSINTYIYTEIEIETISHFLNESITIF